MSRKELEQRLEALRKILAEPAGDAQIDGRRRKLTLGQQLLRRLRKEAAGGKASAFEVIAKHAREYPEALAAWQEAKRTGTDEAQATLDGFIRGGVLTVPKSISVEEVGNLIDRGITVQELRDILEDAWRISGGRTVAEEQSGAPKSMPTINL